MKLRLKPLRSVPDFRSGRLFHVRLGTALQIQKVENFDLEVGRKEKSYIIEEEFYFFFGDIPIRAVSRKAQRKLANFPVELHNFIGFDLRSIGIVRIDAFFVDKFAF
jgi:ABC-type long-subunit fatty acid transport system fused permease/ATPase subunit